MCEREGGGQYDRNTLMNHYPRTASLTTKVQNFTFNTDTEQIKITIVINHIFGLHVTSFFSNLFNIYLLFFIALFCLEPICGRREGGR